jgi:protein gp37
MALGSGIEWTNSTWNPVTGCTKMSSGCQHCYAERMAHRLQGTRLLQYRNGFQVTLHPETLELPLRWKKPQTVFVNSMSDLFHDDVPDDFIFSVFDVMRRAPWHTFQVLTKRSRRLAQLDSRLEWVPNVWMGVSIEAAPYKFRIANLTSTGARLKFLSLEPLLICRASTGLLSAGNPVPERAPSNQIGCALSAISASAPPFPSSSNNGAEFTRR